jgi:protein gp37
MRFVKWVVAGGETGPGARPVHPAWVKGLRDQCQAAAVPFLFKSWGEWLPVIRNSEDNVVHLGHGGTVTAKRFAWIDKNGTDFIDDVSQWKNGDQDMALVGKACAGREIDGRTWDQFPEVKS